MMAMVVVSSCCRCRCRRQSHQDAAAGRPHSSRHASRDRAARRQTPGLSLGICPQLSPFHAFVPNALKQQFRTASMLRLRARTVEASLP